MPRKLLELTATVAGERQRFGDAAPFVVVLDATLANGSKGLAAPANGGERPSRVVLKGRTEDDGTGPQRHLDYRFYGSWRDYTPKHGPNAGRTEKQFHFDTFVQATPHTRAGIVAYLDKAPGIGRQFANRLFEKFGGDAVKVLREKPDVAAAAVERLSAEAASEAAAWLDREKALEDCSIELVDLLDGRGFPKAVVKQAVKEWGNRAASVIKEHPYRLMRFRGVGFKRADALYLELGLPPGRLKRQAFCAVHAVNQQQDGHTWVNAGVVEVGLAGAIAGADVKAAKAIELATRGGVLAAMRTDGVSGPMDFDGSMLWLSDERKARSEARLATFVVEALGEI